MLVNCVAYTEGRKLADIPVEDISEYVKRPNCFVWVALKDPEPSELEMMQEEFSLHELAVDDARHGHQRPKIEEYGDSLFAVAAEILAAVAVYAVTFLSFAISGRERRLYLSKAYELVGSWRTVATVPEQA